LKLTSIFGFFIIVFALAITAHAETRYWISWSHHGTNDDYLMAINQFGDIVVQPKLIFNTHCHSTSIASISGSKLVYFANDDDVFRGVVDKNTFAVSGPSVVLHSSDDSSLQITQGASTFFLSAETTDEVLRGFKLNSKGKPSGSTFRLSPRTDGGNDVGGVSADGRMAFSVDEDGPQDKIYLQPLKVSGLPEGDPALAASADDINDVDVSNVLPGGNRFLLYRDNTAKRLILRVVDATTGANKGGTIDLGATDPDHEDQMVAIDPLGGFVLFSDDVQPCDVSGLFFQALDATGHGSGKRKEIIGCGFINSTGNIHGQRGFDVLKD
jgi:hypothetical protein